jgi:hypothetical protein
MFMLQPVTHRIGRPREELATAILPYRKQISTAFGKMFPRGTHPLSRKCHVFPKYAGRPVQGIRGVTFQLFGLCQTTLESFLHDGGIDDILNLR